MRALRVTVAWFIGVLTVPAAVGILYALRSVTALAIGPDVPGALPLQQLARGEAQPFARVVLAWVPAGLVAGLALRRLGRVRSVPGMVGLGLAALALLIVAGAAADAVAVSEPLGPHVGPQLRRSGTWVALTCLLVGAAIVSWWPAKRPAAPPAAPSVG